MPFAGTAKNYSALKSPQHWRCAHNSFLHAVWASDALVIYHVQVDEVAERLMPPGVRSLRSMLHATAVEVLLYLTPLHCADMLSSLVEAMNAQFSKFMLRHPDFQVLKCAFTPLQGLMMLP